MLALLDGQHGNQRLLVFAVAIPIVTTPAGVATAISVAATPAVTVAPTIASVAIAAGLAVPAIPIVGLSFALTRTVRGAGTSSRVAFAVWTVLAAPGLASAIMALSGVAVVIPVTARTVTAAVTVATLAGVVIAGVVMAGVAVAAIISIAR